MRGWLRGLGRVNYEVPPQEAAIISRAAALAGVDIRLSELAGIPRDMRTEAEHDEIERLMERRSRLTAPPPVPVVPGRSP
jgi:hypothetical protein